jgi:hypothetical protein
MLVNVVEQQVLTKILKIQASNYRGRGPVVQPGMNA